MEIRKVTQTDDFAAIGDIYAHSWKTAYKGIVPQDYLDELHGSRWADFLASNHDNSFIVMDAGKYIGTSSVCAARDEKMAGWGEIISIYLLPEYLGKGYAEPLLNCSINALAAMGFTDVYLWVLEENTRAKRFYEKHGFGHNGDVENIAISGKSLKEIRYTKHLQ